LIESGHFSQLPPIANELPGVARFGSENSLALAAGTKTIFTGKPPFTWDTVPDFICYLRVSTQRQGQSGLGIEAQRSAVEAYIRQTGGTLLKEFVEVESGSCRKRPVLVQSISLCRKQKATLVIAKLDRLARNVAFVSSLMESGIEFVAVDAPYANRLMIHIFAAFAEHERALISERTKAALAAAKAKGTQLGLNGRQLALVNRASAMEFAETMRSPVQNALAGGIITLAQIASKLNSNGLRTRKGFEWRAGGIHRLLQRLELGPDPHQLR
jgi:DNA invertase Pin-like site-specific DNA recombinase